MDMWLKKIGYDGGFFFFFFDFPYFSIEMWNILRDLIICYYVFVICCPSIEIVLLWDNDWKFGDEEEMKNPYFFKELIGTQTLGISDRGINLNFITNEADKIDIII